MSKIDGQITGLRKAAQVYRNLGKYAIEVVLLDAADTITELRGALQVASVDCRHLAAENAKLRDSLKALMMGTYAELCTDRDKPQCCECSMRRGDDTCVAADAMLLLGIDMYGEPL